MKYGRYEIKKELGRGAMGVVYQAHDPHIDRSVALKVLRQDRVTNKEFVQRFLKEAQAIGRLSHPNIVIVYDVGEDQNTIYIAMEFLEGRPLQEVIKDEELTIEQKVKIGIQVALALHYAHQKGIGHRDIKPGNIIVQPDDQVKITDFGIAHIEDPSAAEQTQAGVILGSPAYMAPEQVMGASVDGRTDLYSLGSILYELCAGKRPIKGENMAALFRAITQDKPIAPQKVNPELSSDLSQTILKCLEKEPDKRFQTGKELAEALKNFTKEDQSLSPSPSKLTLKPITLFLSIAVFLIILVGGLYLVIGRDSQKKPEIPPRKEQVVDTASLAVQSAPSGAYVFIDNTLRGKAPLNLKLSPGKHDVRLTLPEHYDWEARVQLKEGENPLSVRLISSNEE